MRKLLLSVLVGSLFAVNVYATPIVGNGGFETVDGTVGLRGLALEDLQLNDQWDVFSALPGGWFLGINESGIEVQSNSVVHAYEGNHYVELDSNGNPGFDNSSMTQILSLNAAGEYILKFRYRARVDIEGSNGIEYAIAGEFGYISKERIEAPDWILQTLDFTILTPGDYSLVFRATGAEDSLGGFLDDISVDFVSEIIPNPEPATMILLGIGILGIAGSCRKKLM